MCVCVRWGGAAAMVERGPVAARSRPAAEGGGGGVGGGEAAGPAGRRGPLPAAGALRGGDRAPALRSLPPHRHAHTHTPGGKEGGKGEAAAGRPRAHASGRGGCGRLREQVAPAPLRARPAAGREVGSRLQPFAGLFFCLFPFFPFFILPPPPFFFSRLFFLNFPFADCKWMPCGSVLGRRCPFAYELGSGAAAGRAASLNAANHASRMGFLLLFFLLPLICPKGGISRVSLFWGYTTSG